MEDLAEGGEKGGPPWFGPRGGPGDRGVRDKKRLDPVRVSVESFFEDRHQVGGRGRGRNE